MFKVLPHRKISVLMASAVTDMASKYALLAHKSLFLLFILILSPHSVHYVDGDVQFVSQMIHKYWECLFQENVIKIEE